MAEIRFMEQSHQILGWYGQFAQCHNDEPQEFIAEVARTCYKSVAEGEWANERLVRSLIRNGHDAMIEHSFLSVRFHTSRAIANEIVRHRHFSFAQQSSRYVNYDRHGFEFVLPAAAWEGEMDERSLDRIKGACEFAAEQYEALVASGERPEVARDVLPLCTKTEIVVSGNFREWRHMLRLRTARDAHPDMRALMTPLLEDLRDFIPVVFDDIEVPE